MIKTNNKHVEIGYLLQRFENDCNELARLVNKYLFNDERHWYWVGDYVGGTCYFGDTDFLSPIDMVVILDNNVTYEQYAEWRDANIEYHDTKGYVSLRSWLTGCRHFMLEDKAGKGIGE